MRQCPSCSATYQDDVAECPVDGASLITTEPGHLRTEPGRLRTEPGHARTDPGHARTEPGRARTEPGQPRTDAREPRTNPTEEEEEDQLALAPPKMIGEYQIEGTLAVGGMGAVYAGIHPLISKRVAIKVLTPRYASDPKAVARFLQEARSVNEIGHHNIVDIFAVGELEDGRTYLVMELLDGSPLSHVLAHAGRMRPGEVLPVYQQLCDALDAAHKLGFIHRDLKPDNIFVLHRPPRPFVKILDFGLAKLRGSRLSDDTEVGMVVGTPEYMPPEQCRGEEVDLRADIYALGVMLYELCTGSRPFNDPSALGVLSKQEHVIPAPPSRLVAMSPELEKVILTAMAKDRSLRYPSVMVLLEHLRRAVPEPLPWTEDLFPQYTQQTMHSHREAAIGAALLPAAPAFRPPVSPLTPPPPPRPGPGLLPLTVAAPSAHGAGDDENVRTQVNTPRAAAPQPEAISGEISRAELDDEPPTDIDPITTFPLERESHSDELLLSAQGSGRAVTPSRAEPETSRAPRPDRQRPVVVVDRPLQDQRDEVNEPLDDFVAVSVVDTGTMGLRGNGGRGARVSGTSKRPGFIPSATIPLAPAEPPPPGSGHALAELDTAPVKVTSERRVNTTPARGAPAGGSMPPPVPRPAGAKPVFSVDGPLEQTANVLERRSARTARLPSIEEPARKLHLGRFAAAVAILLLLGLVLVLVLRSL